MSNLASAKKSIKDELSAARQGLAFYQSRVETLEQAFAQIESIDDTPAAAAKQSKEETKVVAKNVAKSASRKVARTAFKKTAKPAAKKAENSKANGRKVVVRQQGELPSTKGDYWFDLVTDQPLGAAEIADRAIEQLGFTPTKAQVQTLKQRSNPGLNHLVETDRIKNSGTGRDRRYFKAPA